jgi:hypothetical protein
VDAEARKRTVHGAEKIKQVRLQVRVNSGARPISRSTFLEIRKCLLKRLHRPFNGDYLFRIAGRQK